MPQLPTLTSHVEQWTRDLDYGSVLAADREPWLVIAPKPMNGDPHFEITPMLSSRWDELAGNIRDGVRRRGARPRMGRRPGGPGSHPRAG
jgi:hypothetical protein